MLTLLFFLFLLLVIGGVLYFLHQSYLKNNLRERLQFGMSIDQENEDAGLDLTAGDYGLTGNARFLYFLSRFFDSPNGKLILFGVGGLITFGALTLFGVETTSLFISTMAGGAVLFLLVTFVLRSRSSRRLVQIKFELPNALQGIAALMEGGLAFETSLAHIVRESDNKHPLYADLAIMIEAMQRGRRRNEALKLWAQRANQQSVSDVTAGMMQADQTGASLGTVLKHHANTLLKENEAELIRRAERIPIYMLAPMMLCILPSIFLIAAGPSVVRLVNMFAKIMAKA